MATTVIRGFSVDQMRSIAESIPEPKTVTFVDGEWFEVETPDIDADSDLDSQSPTSIL